MRNITGILIIMLMTLAGCKNQAGNNNEILSGINAYLAAGELTRASDVADSVLEISNDERVRWKADSLGQIAKRILLDFTLTEEQVTEQLRGNMGDRFSVEDKKRWEENGWLEYRVINGEKRYFKRAASNLVLLNQFHLARSERDSAIAQSKEIIFRKNHTQSIIRASEQQPVPVLPVEMVINYTVTVKADAVPDGEIIRCWLPYPKENHLRQKNAYLEAISNEDFILAPDTCVHRTIYLENKAIKGKPTIFSILYSYTSLGQYVNLSSINIQPYNTKSDLYKKYTAEQPPQICFTEDVKNLADSITGNEKDPREIVRKLFYWFNQNIPWAGAPEYSIISNIPEYVIKNKRGDCGMQTFLFISMLRYKGIPVHWQSGWMVSPDGKDLHDWCEIYYEGLGWVPADIQFNLQFSNDKETKEFYMSGIDSYRMIINDDISGTLFPPKKYLRSDPFDFQRGEVEWDGGNLYFDKWDYQMNIEYTQSQPARESVNQGKTVRTGFIHEAHMQSSESLTTTKL
jgi:hypothetical protein